MTISEALEAERQTLGLSVYELAKRTGLDQSALAKVLDGRTANPAWLTVTKLLAALGKTMTWLDKRTK